MNITGASLLSQPEAPFTRSLIDGGGANYAAANWRPALLFIFWPGAAFTHGMAASAIILGEARDLTTPMTNS
jgi:hypothetical protein